MTEFKTGDKVVFIPGVKRQLPNYAFIMFSQAPYMVVRDATYLQGELQLYCRDPISERLYDTCLWVKISEVKLWERPSKPLPDIEIYED